MISARSLVQSWYEEITQRTYRPPLTPVRELRASETVEHQWHSTGENPEFRIEPPLPQGWVRLRLRGRARPAALLTLHIQREGERGRSGALRLGALNPTGGVIDRFVSFRHARSAHLDPSLGPGHFTIEEFSLQRVGLWKVAWHAAASYLAREPRPNPWRVAVRATRLLRVSGVHGLRNAVASRIQDAGRSASPYEAWLEHEWLDAEAKARLRTTVDAFRYKPTISLVATIEAQPVWQVTSFLDSLRVQIYPNWEFSLAYTASTLAETKAALERYVSEDPRLKVAVDSAERTDPLARAIANATGEFIAIVGPDDELSQDALARIALAINQTREADVVYSDEDRIDDAGSRSAPYFKPDWSPETLLGSMYLGRLTVYRRSVVEAVGGFAKSFGEGVEYDLALRVTEKTSRVLHVAKVLCHRRIGRSVDRPNADVDRAALQAVRLAVARRDYHATVEPHQLFQDHHIVRMTADRHKKISVVIPTRDRAELLERCLESVFCLTTHPNFDVCVVDNGSKEQATFGVLRRFERRWPGRFRVIRRDIPFNFPALVNAGVAETDGELVLLLNNDTEVLEGSWLDDMAGYAERPEIGAVGALLVYPNGTVQHGGVILVAGAVAGHSHAGQPANAPGYFGRLLAQSNYAAVTAACLMVRRELFIEAGGFDEKLAVAYNDVDFCLRLHRRGYRNVCLGQVRLLHHESLSRGSDERAERRARSVAESHLMRERWGSVLDRDPYYNPNLTSAPPDFTPAPSRPNVDDVVAGEASATGDPRAAAGPRWVGSPDPALLVAGHSHRYAFLDHYNRSGESARVAILEVASNADIETDLYWDIALGTARGRGVPLVIVWDGNQHNVHFLLESAERFSVYPASGPWADGRSRPLIPRSLFREFFAPSVERLRAVLARSNGARVIVLGTPPPKPDGHVRDRLHNEPLLADAAASLGMTPSTLEVTPLPVRVELWRITQELLREVADTFGAPFVAVPEKALSGGALTSDMSYPDVTHANGLWAEIMVDATTAALAGR